MKRKHLPLWLVLVVLMPLVFGFGIGTLQTTLANVPADRTLEKPAIGTKVNDAASLRDVRGNQRVLSDLQGEKGTVAVFIGTECPLANLYIPRLLELEKAYRERGITFLAIYPNEAEDLGEIAAHANDRSIPFPVLKDFGQELADLLGAQRTPEVVLLDADMTIRYRGRIDDQYGVGSRRQTPKHEDLKVALEDLLAGKPIRRPETPADGCLIGRRAASPQSSRQATYDEHVAAIFEQRCQTCHRSGRSAPFELVSYEDAVQWSGPIREVVSEHRMPPWHADPRYGRFSNDRSLTPEEIDAVVSWVDAGTPRGDVDRKARPAVTWQDGWNIGDPDMVFEMPFEWEVAADGVLPYAMSIVPTNFTEDRWVTMAEAMPGNPQVVHHIIVYMISPDRLDPVTEDEDMSVLVAWAPGDMPLVCPPGTALRVPKGAELLFELHYTPNGVKQTDRSRVAVKFAKEPPEREIQINMFANEGIRIPPHASHHQEVRVHTFKQDARLLSLIPHMHWRGKSYEYEAIYPDGRTEKLLSVPRWDFNWQTSYWFADGIKVPKGTKIRSVATWDNSRFNPFNPDPNREVTWGLQTWDEMMVGWMTYVWEDPSYRPESRPAPKNGSEIAFTILDRNKDGLINPSELPAKAAAGLAEMGLDSRQSLPPAAFKLVFGIIQQELLGRRAENDASISPASKSID